MDSFDFFVQGKYKKLQPNMVYLVVIIWYSNL